MDAPQELTCMECGGTAHIVTTPPPDDPFEPGDIATYICADCNHRIDVVLEGEE